jgi:DNA repair protein RadC
MTRKSAAPTYLREATLTYRAVRGAPRDLFPDRPITSSADVDRVLRPMLAGRITESLVVLALTGRHTVIGLHEVARGAVNHVHCAPCDLFRYPLMAGAVSLILAHYVPRIIMGVLLPPRLCAWCASCAPRSRPLIAAAAT